MEAREERMIRAGLGAASKAAVPARDAQPPSSGWSSAQILAMQRHRGNRAVASMLQRARAQSLPRRSLVQRMIIPSRGNAAVNTLAELNTELPGFNPILPAGVVLPLPLATFGPAPSAARVDAAIQASPDHIYDYIDVQDVIDAVNAILALPIATASITYAAHGDKHFGGSNDVAQGGDQWSVGKPAAQAIMVADIQRLSGLIRANANGATTYYYTNDAAGNIGTVNGAATTRYSIQIDYNLADDSVSYHGYPDKDYVAVGLGYAKANKLWAG